MTLVLLILGLLCLGYYAACVLYAGFGASFLWIWLVGGIAFLILAGALFYCDKQGIAIHIPFPLKCVLGTGLVCCIGLFLVMEGLIFSGMGKKGQPELDYIVVLGCQVNGEKPSKFLRKRLETAKEYLRANPGTKAVLSGGQGSGEDISEAECMRRYLSKAGIGEDRLILEDQSTTTYENLKFSQEYLKADRDTVGIVTNNFHVYRSLRIAAKAGYTQTVGIAAPAGTVLQIHYLVREFFALMRELLRGSV